MDMSYHLDDVRFQVHFFPIARRSAAVGLNLTLRLCFTGLTTPVEKLKPPAQVQLIGSSSTMLPIRTGVLFSIAHKTNSVWARMISLTTFLLWPVMAESLSISSVSIIVAVFLLISILIRWCAHGRGRTCVFRALWKLKLWHTQQRMDALPLSYVRLFGGCWRDPTRTAVKTSG